MYSLIILSPRLCVMENRYTGFDWTLVRASMHLPPACYNGDIALRINNLSLTHPWWGFTGISLLLTQQSAQFTIRRNGVPRLINVSVGNLREWMDCVMKGLNKITCCLLAALLMPCAGHAENEQYGANFNNADIRQFVEIVGQHLGKTSWSALRYRNHFRTQ